MSLRKKIFIFLVLFLSCVLFLFFSITKESYKIKYHDFFDDKALELREGPGLDIDKLEHIDDNANKIERYEQLNFLEKDNTKADEEVLLTEDMFFKDALEAKSLKKMIVIEKD